MFCPVCFDVRDGPRVAFFVTTIFLSLLPLAMLGGLWWWIRSRSRAADQAAANSP
jgi:hypothetical protein